MSATLSNGMLARIVPDEHGIALVVDGIMQSHVAHAGAPRYRTARWMLTAIAALESPARVLCIGGGAMTIPREIIAAHPGARVTVIELEQAIVDLVANAAPLPDGVDVVVGDGRAWLERSHETFDAIVVDVFAGGRVPPAFTSLEWFRTVAAHVRPRGLLLANIADGPGLAFAGKQLATLRAAFDHVALIVQGSVLAGARFGNLILLGSSAPIPIERMRPALRDDEARAAVLADARLESPGATVVRDADATWSPTPTRAAFLAPPSDDRFARADESRWAAERGHTREY